MGGKPQAIPEPVLMLTLVNPKRLRPAVAPLGLGYVGQAARGPRTGTSCASSGGARADPVASGGQMVEQDLEADAD